MNKDLKAEILSDTLNRFLNLWLGGLGVLGFDELLSDACVEVLCIQRVLLVEFDFQSTDECNIDVFWTKALLQSFTVLVEVLLSPCQSKSGGFFRGGYYGQCIDDTAMPIKTRSHEVEKDSFYMNGL